MIDLAPEPENVFLVTIKIPGEAAALIVEDNEELAGLAVAAGMNVVGSMEALLRQTHPALLLGTGTAQTVKERALDAGASIIIIDHNLTPTQQRNWEELTSMSVADRQGLIIEIFADRAHTKEARLQVELARMRYLLPRLASSYANLSRQRGGAKGNRGQGETQIEVDRRAIQNRIHHVEERIKEVRERRGVSRKQREVRRVPTIAIVGYTNAGKSSLHRSLSGSQTMVADALFATLDPTVRQVRLPGGTDAVVVDTVGFVRRLPHDLVKAFKSTLEEAALADVLIHVVDSSSPWALEHLKASTLVLAEIGAGDCPVILVLNKIDKATNLQELSTTCVLEGFDEPIGVCALNGQGFVKLLEKVEATIHERSVVRELLLPYSDGKTLAWLYAQGCILERLDQEQGVFLRLRLAKEQEMNLCSNGFAFSST